MPSQHARLKGCCVLLDVGCRAMVNLLEMAGWVTGSGSRPSTPWPSLPCQQPGDLPQVVCANDDFGSPGKRMGSLPPGPRAPVTALFFFLVLNKGHRRCAPGSPHRGHAL